MFVDLGAIDEADILFLDGRAVANTIADRTAARHYRIPAQFVRAGPATLALEVLDVQGEGGLLGRPEEMRITCPEAGDANTPIGRAMSQLIEQYQAQNHPDLSAPNAPELIFSKANILLPPEARVPVAPRREPPKHQPKAPVAQPKPPVQKTSEAPPLPTAPPVPTMRALPVAATARTAQPDMSTLNPAQMGQMVREASQEDLAAIEEALYGMSGRDVLLRI